MGGDEQGVGTLPDQAVERAVEIVLACHVQNDGASSQSPDRSLGILPFGLGGVIVGIHQQRHLRPTDQLSEALIFISSIYQLFVRRFAANKASGPHLGPQTGSGSRDRTPRPPLRTFLESCAKYVRVAGGVHA